MMNFMKSVKYTPVPVEDRDEHVIDFSGDGKNVFDYHSTFDFGMPNSKSIFKSAFRYSNWNPNVTSVEISEVESESSLIGQICSPIMTALSYIIFFLTLPISAWFSIYVVKEHERLVVYRLGKLRSCNGPGRSLVLPCIDRCARIDVRTRAFSVPPQTVMTSDGAAIEIGADMYFQVRDAVKSVSCVQDMDHSMRVLSETNLKNIMCHYSLPQAIGDRLSIGRALQEEVSRTTSDWGVDITKVELSPVKVIQEANPLLEGANLVNAPLNWLGPMLFPPGTTQLPIQPLQDRGLLPPEQGQMEQLAQLGKLLAPGLINMAGAAKHQVAPAPVVRRSMTPQDLVEAAHPHLNSSLVTQIGATFLFNVTGDHGGIFFLDLKNGDGQIGEGSLPKGEPDVTLTLNSSDFEQLFQGQMTAFQAYVSGRLKITGDMHAAMALGEVVAQLKGVL